MKYTYLLINFFTILVPLCCSFDSRIRFYSRWRYYLPGLCWTAIFFLVWDYFKTLYGVWSFNDSYIIGIKILGLPLEEILFFFTVPYACTFIYESLRYYQLRRIFPDGVRYLMLVVSFVMFIASFSLIHRVYTFSVLFIFGLVCPIALLVLNGARLDRFIQMYLISLLPMLVVNGLLTALPVVIYDNTANLGLRITTIPVEDFVYSAILLMMNIALYEWKLKRSLE